MTKPESASKSSLRIFMTADPIGGVWTFSLDLIKALSGSGIEFALATMGAPLTDPQRQSVAAIPNLTLYESSYKLEWMEDPWEDVANAGDWLLKSAAGFNPDLIHLNGYAHAPLPWGKPVLVAAHSCVFSWFQAVKGAPPPESAWRRYREEVQLGLAAADLVTAPTAAMLRTLSINYGSVFPNWQVIHNGRNPALFRCGPKKTLILTGGRLWDEAKNIRLLDRAAAALPWPVFAAGENRHPNGMEIQAENLHHLGPLSPDLFANRLSQASIYALPARYEPFGLSALEAALSGAALVLGDIPSLREIWGNSAIFVPSNDEAAWVHALNSLILQPARRSHLAWLAWKQAHIFTAQKMANGYLNAYRKLLNPNTENHENYSVLPLAAVRLEPRKRPFSPRIRQRTSGTRT